MADEASSAPLPCAQSAPASQRSEPSVHAPGVASMRPGRQFSGPARDAAPTLLELWNARCALGAVYEKIDESGHPTLETALLAAMSAMDGQIVTQPSRSADDLRGKLGFVHYCLANRPDLDQDERAMLSAANDMERLMSDGALAPSRGPWRGQERSAERHDSAIARLFRQWQECGAAIEAASAVGDEAPALRERWVWLEEQIALTPATCAADIRIKVDLSRDALGDVVPYDAASSPYSTELLTAGLLADVERLLLDAEPMPRREARHPSDDGCDVTRQPGEEA